ncbi:MAG TPA: phosphatidate cytidylyltransferase [Rhodanobacteraceae bacterium]|jgi:phosphatidate cytidylyltransferase|nr:phosphatidate cytidylyltransferase [Rhodanobacteraceae bacterium]
MLKQRVLTALVLAPLIVALVFLTNTPVFAVLLAVIFLAGLWEWTRMSGMRNRPLRACLLVGYAIVMALLWPVVRSQWWWLPALIGVAWWLLAFMWLRNISFGASPTRAHTALKLFAGLLVVVPAWCAVVALHGAHVTCAPPRAAWWVIFFATIVVAADVGAYFAGSRLGKHKLAPAISPGKTWEGVYGALACSAIIGLAGGWIAHAPAGLLVGVIALALVTVLFSIVGDLFESLIKRHAGVKDSGTLFPGHGGLFDRMDSIVAALPVFVLGKALLGL